MAREAGVRVYGGGEQFVEKGLGNVKRERTRETGIASNMTPFSPTIHVQLHVLLIQLLWLSRDKERKKDAVQTHNIFSPFFVGSSKCKDVS